jgi:hypothetical protein
MTSGQTTYDLRRLRTHDLIARIPHTHRYQVTDSGLRHALFLTRAHTRLLRTGLAEIHGPPYRPSSASPPTPTRPQSPSSPEQPDSPPDCNQRT